MHNLRTLDNSRANLKRLAIRLSAWIRRKRSSWAISTEMDICIRWKNCKPTIMISPVMPKASSFRTVSMISGSMLATFNLAPVMIPANLPAIAFGIGGTPMATTSIQMPLRSWCLVMAVAAIALATTSSNKTCRAGRRDRRRNSHRSLSALLLQIEPHRTSFLSSCNSGLPRRHFHFCRTWSKN